MVAYARYSRVVDEEKKKEKILLGDCYDSFLSNLVVGAIASLISLKRPIEKSLENPDLNITRIFWINI